MIRLVVLLKKKKVADLSTVTVSVTYFNFVTVTHENNYICILMMIFRHITEEKKCRSTMYK